MSSVRKPGVLGWLMGLWGPDAGELGGRGTRAGLTRRLWDRQWAS